MESATFLARGRSGTASSEPSRLLLLLLAANLAVLDVAWMPADRAGLSVPEAAYLGWGFGQLALLAAWLIYGRAAYLSRLAGALAGVVMFAFLFAELMQPGPPMVASMLLAYMVLLVIGCRLKGTAASGLPAARRWQFSIRSWLAWIATLAVLLAGVRHAELPWEAAWTMSLYTVCLAGVAGAALTSYAWPDRVCVRLLGCAVLAALVGYGMARVEGAVPGGTFVVMTLVQTAVICGTMRLVRGAL